MATSGRGALPEWLQRTLLRRQGRDQDRARPHRRLPRLAARPLEDLARDLGRLGVLMAVVDLGDSPDKVERMRGVSLAYDRVLVAACRSLELPEPCAPMAAIDRLETEANLALHGLDW